MAGIPSTCKLILHNILKDINTGAMLRSAHCLGCDELIVSGKQKYLIYISVFKPSSFFIIFHKYITISLFSTFFVSRVPTTGTQGSHALLPRRHTYSVREAIETCKAENYEVVGVEIGGICLSKVKFDKPTAFLMGGEGIGIPEQTLALCDRIVTIPQYGMIQFFLSTSLLEFIFLFHRMLGFDDIYIFVFNIT